MLDRIARLSFRNHPGKMDIRLGIVGPACWYAGLEFNPYNIQCGASVLSKAFVPVNTSVSAEPTQNLSTEVSTEAADEVKSAPNNDPQSVNREPIIDDEPLVPDEYERRRCVLEAREQDEAREWEREFYDDGYQHD